MKEAKIIKRKYFASTMTDKNRKHYLLSVYDYEKLPGVVANIRIADQRLVFPTLRFIFEGADVDFLSFEDFLRCLNLQTLDFFIFLLKDEMIMLREDFLEILRKRCKNTPIMSSFFEYIHMNDSDKECE